MRPCTIRRSIVIGRFKRSRQGGWEGDINTLTIQRHIRLVPNDDRVNAASPAFCVMLGWQSIGDAWERRSQGEPPRDYLRVFINDPIHPIRAALFPDDEGITAQMLWRSGLPSSDRQGGENGGG